MAAQPPKAGEQPPPDLPYITGMSDTLANYLRTFSLWCRNGFRDKMPLREASPQLLLLSPGGLTFSIGVGDSGKLTSTPVAFSTGAPGTPVLTFAPVTLTGMTTVATPAGTTSVTFVMMGLAATFNSVVATRAFVDVSGVVANSVNNGETDIALFVGTGSPPTNGVAVPGGATQIGQAVSFKSSSGSGALTPFAMTGLGSIAPGQVYWIDLALRASAGTASVSNLNFCWMGLP